MSHSETVDGARDLEKNDTQSRVPCSWGQDTVLHREKAWLSGAKECPRLFLGFFPVVILLRFLWEGRTELRQKKLIESQASLPQATWLPDGPCPMFSFITDRDSSVCYPTEVAGKLP